MTNNRLNGLVRLHFAEPSAWHANPLIKGVWCYGTPIRSSRVCGVMARQSVHQGCVVLWNANPLIKGVWCYGTPIR